MSDPAIMVDQALGHIPPLIPIMGAKGRQYNPVLQRSIPK